LLALEGILGATLGSAVFVWPGLGLNSLVYLVALWALVTGLVELALALRIQTLERAGLPLGITGVASIVFAALILGWPNVSAWVVVSLLGCYAVTSGASMLGLAQRLRRLQLRPRRQFEHALP
jgi:uncharacterized membrane protein HdeD (DUF308 family)